MRRGLVLVFALAVLFSVSPVHAKVTNWNVNIEFRDTANNIITSIQPGQTFYINATISATSDTGSTFPLAKLSMPPGFTIIPNKVNDGTYDIEEHSVHFYSLEADGDWYVTGSSLADGTNWNTGWVVKADDYLIPGKNYTFFIAMYDEDTTGGTKTSYYKNFPAYYQGWGNKFYKDIYVQPTISTLTVSVNSTTYDIGGGVTVEGFKIGDTVLISGTTEPNANVNITIWKPQYTIGAKITTTADGSGNFQATYTLTENWDRRGIYTVEVIAYKAPNLIARTKINFYVGDNIAQNDKAFRSKRVSPPDISYSCGDCHTAVFFNYSVMSQADQINPGSEGTPDPHKEHPYRSPPTENCDWIHWIHDPLPEFNESRLASGVLLKQDRVTAGRSYTQPGEITHLAEWERDDKTPPPYAITEFYAEPLNYPDSAGEWTACSMCHLNVRGYSYVRTDNTLTCTPKGNNRPGCHVVEREGTHKYTPSCQNCHVPSGKSLKDVELPNCLKCHAIKNYWEYGVGTSHATDSSGSDITDAVMADDENVFRLDTSGQYVEANISAPFREKALQVIKIGVNWNGTTSGGAGNQQIELQYLDVNGIWQSAGLSPARTTPFEATDYFIIKNTSDPSLTNPAGLNEHGEIVVRVVYPTDGNSKEFADIDYIFMDILADDSIALEGAHEGVECLNCHGHSHNATRQIYCTSCKGQKLAPEGEHVWQKKNATGGDIIEGVNTSLWCTECHGGYGHTSITNTPSCAKCHNPSVANKSWKRYSYTEIPPWGLDNIHGRANLFCEDCHIDNHNVTLPSCNAEGCHIANISDTVPSSGYYATWDDSTKTHDPSHSSGTNYTIEMHAYNASGWYGKSDKKWGATCDECHNNHTSEVYLKLENKWINASTDSMVHSTNRSIAEMVPYNESYASYDAKWCVDCHQDRGSHYGWSCLDCHYRDDGDDTFKEPAFHSAKIAKSGGGGPNCIGCHDIGGSATHIINVTALNLSVHGGIVTNSSTYSTYGLNQSCYACHTSDGLAPDDMGDRYNNPWTCVDCHTSGGAKAGAYGAPIVSEHYRSGDNITAVGYASTDVLSCLACHQNATDASLRDFMLIPANDPNEGSSVSDVDGDGIKGGNISFYHYGKDNSWLRTGPGGSTSCQFCHQNNSIFTAVMSDSTHNSMQNHTDNAVVDCTDCHGTGWIHNASLTKPVLTASDDSVCTSCHTTKSRHNSAGNRANAEEVKCIACHTGDVNTYQPRDIHGIKIINSSGGYEQWGTSSPATCVTCHQSNLGGKFANASQVPSPLNHSEDPIAGQKWNKTSQAYWTPGDDQSACNYCHGDSRHEANALGNASAIEDSLSRNATDLSTTSWCAGCHYSEASNYNGTAFSPQPPEIITWGGTANDGTSFQNHSGYLSSGYDDSVCTSCHSGSTSSTALYPHNVYEGVAGGPNCISCHDIGQNGAPKHINFTAVNSSENIHFNLNNATPVSYDPVNRICLGCHSSDGSEPASGHPTGYKSPYTCVDCHVNSPPAHASNAPQVREHYRNGSEVKAVTDAASDVLSCIACHQNSTTANTMLIPANDPDYGSFDADGDGVSGGNISASHYGKKRTDIVSGGVTSCAYCHQNAGSEFAGVFNKSGNADMLNHTDNTVVDCTDSNCHSSGRIHDSALTKPPTMYNNTYCTTCHTGKELHGSNTITGISPQGSGVNCYDCHADENKEVAPIHGISYINTTGGFTVWDNSSAATCKTCHQSSVADAAIGATAPKIRSPLHHSDDPIAGWKWNASGYWNDTNSVEYDDSCYFCHGSVKHSANAMGLIVTNNVTGSNSYNTSSFDTSYWCANCHYSNSADNYAGDLFTPKVVEITSWPVNSSDGQQEFVNHTSYISSGHTDSVCKGCHGGFAPETTGDFAHDVAIGAAGGPNCISCHDIGANPSVTHVINVSALQQGVHGNIDTPADDATYGLNQSCYACHTSDGQAPPEGDMGDRAFNPWTCVDCHTSGGAKAGAYGAPIVSEHYRSGDNITAVGYASTDVLSCLACHQNATDASLRDFMLIPANDPNEGSSVSDVDGDGIKGGNISFYHYGKDNSWLRTGPGGSTSCQFCHQNNSIFTAVMSDSTHNSMQNHTDNAVVDCTDCHGTGWIHNASLTKPVLTASDDSVCTSCHTTKSRHNSAGNRANAEEVKCIACHTGDVNTYQPRDIHGIKIINSSGGYEQWGTSSPATCVTCHQSNLGGKFANASQVPSPLNHSEDPIAGQKWNKTSQAYWTPGDDQSACNYCHGDSRHEANALGNASAIEDSLSRNATDLSTTSWCAGCHYSEASNYNGTAFSPQPPEIITWGGTANDGTTFKNHSEFGISPSSYTDDKCTSCHSGSTSSTALYPHNVYEGVAGGPECTTCHYIGSANPNINVTAFSLGVHGKIVTNSSTFSTYGYNQSCWACHATDGSVTPSGHPDRQKNPWTCVDCHTSGGAKAGAYGAPIVSEHYRNGSEVKAVTDAASDVLSCIACHQNSTTANTMIIPANDPDEGSADMIDVDGDGTKGGNLSFYHYGKNRTDLITGGITSCEYCHVGGGNEFASLFNNTLNTNITNHTDNNNPYCTGCHGSGRIHDAAIFKTSVTNSTFCVSCHGSDAVPKQAHATDTSENTLGSGVPCADCHTSVPRDIHAARYILANGSYSAPYDNSTYAVANCVDCHQPGGVPSANSKFSSAPIISKPMNHSDSNLSGQKWGNYWAHGDDQSTCNFCHGDTRHNSSGLGKARVVMGSNSLNQSLDAGIWCANCHYKVSSEYNETKLLNTFGVLPPEITNYSTGEINFSDGSTSQNHSELNLDSNYKDSQCDGCHGYNNPIKTSGSFVHQVAVGNVGAEPGGPDCVSCHKPGGYAETYNHSIDTDVMESSSYIHRYLNKDATASTSLSTTLNKACWACHDPKGQGVEPGAKEHYNTTTTAKRCTDCHLSGAFGAPVVSEHFWNAQEIKLNKTTACEDCHARAEMVLNHTDPSPSIAENATMNASHYGTKRNDVKAKTGNGYCGYCHQQQHSDSTAAFNDLFNDPAKQRIPRHSNGTRHNYDTCVRCHNAYNRNLHDITVIKNNINTINCYLCHSVTEGWAYVHGFEKSKTLDCQDCHVGDTGTIHPISYIRSDGTYKNYSVTTPKKADCVDCHLGSNSAIDTAMQTYYGKVPPRFATFKHNLSTTYWSTTKQACLYCHNPVHWEAVGVSRIAAAKAGTKYRQIRDDHKPLNNTLWNTTWCASCHYSGDSDYDDVQYVLTKSSLYGRSPLPPVISTPSSHYGADITVNYTDAKCGESTCHGGSYTPSDGLTPFMHNITN
jgi:hypothetical protein